MGSKKKIWTVIGVVAFIVAISVAIAIVVREHGDKKTTTASKSPSRNESNITHRTDTNAYGHQRLRVPPEPYGYITDSEITEVTPPIDWQVTWLNQDNRFPMDIMGPKGYGTHFFPAKDGYYMNNGF